MPNSQYSRKKRRKTPRYGGLITFLVLVICLIGIVVFLISVFGHQKTNESANQSSQAVSKQSKSSAKEDKSSKKQDDTLPNSKTTDWDLVLVNREHAKEEMNPELTQIGNISVDSRIAQAAQEFLAAAQAINPAEHFISGYRSVAYQTTLYNQYVEQEMAANPSLTRQEAEQKVKTYSQPAGMSEHQTGLAIDLSDVDSLNESTTATEVAAIAPNYGFVLRFTADGSSSTGVGHEDWHFRYVGVENAKYMTEYHLTLEQYLKLLK